MAEFTQKWAIISLLEAAPEGAEFYYTDFPLHLTFAGVFAIDTSGDELVEGLHDLLSHVSKFTIVADQQALFGPKKDIAVMKIHKDPELMHLYGSIHAWLVDHGATYNAPEYQGNGYLPHATVQKTAHLQPNEQRSITSISLIDLYPNQDGYQRKIFKTIEL